MALAGREADVDVPFGFDEAALLCEEPSDRDLVLVPWSMDLGCDLVPVCPRDAMVRALGAHSVLADG